MEKIKPVGTEKHEIENGDESKVLADLKSSENQISEARFKTISYVHKNYGKSFKVSIETSIAEIKPAVTENYIWNSQWNIKKTLF